MTTTTTRGIRLPLTPRGRKAITAEDAELARLAKAIGHPARAAILRLLLGKGECVCGVIVERLPLAQATVSQHLKVLKEAGWIQGTIDGPRVCYCARPETARRLLELTSELAEIKERKTS
ncbi:MAG TPA: metalloregulator ArsR/SmtB family transcription factor [Candidatus Eisenbacteria bacterium]